MWMILAHLLTRPPRRLLRIATSEDCKIDVWSITKRATWPTPSAQGFMGANAFLPLARTCYSMGTLEDMHLSWKGCVLPRGTVVTTKDNDYLVILGSWLNSPMAGWPRFAEQAAKGHDTLLPSQDQGCHLVCSAAMGPGLGGAN